jgi:hypothetical protein
MPLQDQASASLRFLFPSASANRSSLLVKGSQPFHLIPLQRLDAPAVLGTTPLRRRLTSFAPATVERKIRSCVTGLFLGGVPLSVPSGFDLVDRSRFL